MGHGKGVGVAEDTKLPVVENDEVVNVAVVGVVDEDNDVVNGGGDVSDGLLVEDA